MNFKLVINFMFFLILLSVVYFIFPYILRLLQEYRFARICSRHRWLILTYDGGPSKNLTPMLLDLFLRNAVKANFFCSGLRASRHPEIMQRILSEGHQIGCHAERHLDAWKAWPWMAIKDMEEGYRTLSPWITKSALFRPPYGKTNILIWLFLYGRRAPICYWSMEAGDTRNPLPLPEEVVNRVIKSGGGVVLMHDHEEQRDFKNIEFVLQTTKLLLESARQNGISVCTLNGTLFPKKI